MLVTQAMSFVPGEAGESTPLAPAKAGPAAVAAGRERVERPPALGLDVGDVCSPAWASFGVLPPPASALGRLGFAPTPCRADPASRPAGPWLPLGLGASRIECPLVKPSRCEAVAPEKDFQRRAPPHSTRPEDRPAVDGSRVRPKAAFSVRLAEEEWPAVCCAPPVSGLETGTRSLRLRERWSRSSATLERSALPTGEPCGLDANAGFKTKSWGLPGAGGGVAALLWGLGISADSAPAKNSVTPCSGPGSLCVLCRGRPGATVVNGG